MMFYAKFKEEGTLGVREDSWILGITQYCT